MKHMLARCLSPKSPLSERGLGRFTPNVFLVISFMLLKLFGQHASPAMKQAKHTL